VPECDISDSSEKYTTSKLDLVAVSERGSKGFGIILLKLQVQRSMEKENLRANEAHGFGVGLPVAN
jgi:hypothetical protein